MYVWWNNDVDIVSGMVADVGAMPHEPKVTDEKKVVGSRIMMYDGHQGRSIGKVRHGQEAVFLSSNDALPFRFSYYA